MVDFYAPPQTGDRAWPGRAVAAQKPFRDKAAAIESAMLEDVCEDMGAGFDRNPF
jgi:hypothetical protein